MNDPNEAMRNYLERVRNRPNEDAIHAVARRLDEAQRLLLDADFRWDDPVATAVYDLRLKIMSLEDTIKNLSVELQSTHGGGKK